MLRFYYYNTTRLWCAVFFFLSLHINAINLLIINIGGCHFSCVQREITRKLTFPKQPTNPFLEMVKFLLERIAPVHIDSEAIRSEKNPNLLHKTSVMVGFDLMTFGSRVPFVIPVKGMFLIRIERIVLDKKYLLLFTNIPYTKLL